MRVGGRGRSAFPAIVTAELHIHICGTVRPSPSQSYCNYFVDSTLAELARFGTPELHRRSPPYPHLSGKKPRVRGAHGTDGTMKLATVIANISATEDASALQPRWWYSPCTLPRVGLSSASASASSAANGGRCGGFPRKIFCVGNYEPTREISSELHEAGCVGFVAAGLQKSIDLRGDLTPAH